MFTYRQQIKTQKLCKDNFTKDKCQKLFTYFILNLYHTFNVNIPSSHRGFNGIRLNYKKSYNDNLKQLLLNFFGYPLMTAKIISAIHFEAFILWIKGAIYRSRKRKIKIGLSYEGKK